MLGLGSIIFFTFGILYLLMTLIIFIFEFRTLLSLSFIDPDNI